MSQVHWLARALLLGFLFIIFLTCIYLLLDFLSVWGKLPAGLTRAIWVVVGLVLLGELIGHLALMSGALPERPAK
jgi:hypothetical protein